MHGVRDRTETQTKNMITLIFFALLFAFVGAIVVGTLGDELQSLLTGLIDRLVHHQNSEPDLRKAYNINHRSR